MKWNRTDGDSTEAVRVQVFLWRYKSEPGIVESYKFSAYYQYCWSDFSVAHSSKNDINKKYCPGSVTKN